MPGGFTRVLPDLSFECVHTISLPGSVRRSTGGSATDVRHERRLEEHGEDEAGRGDADAGHNQRRVRSDRAGDVPDEDTGRNLSQVHDAARDPHGLTLATGKCGTRDEARLVGQAETVEEREDGNQGVQLPFRVREKVTGHTNGQAEERVTENHVVDVFLRYLADDERLHDRNRQTDDGEVVAGTRLREPELAGEVHAEERREEREPGIEEKRCRKGNPKPLRGEPVHHVATSRGQVDFLRCVLVADRLGEPGEDESAVDHAQGTREPERRCRFEPTRRGEEVVEASIRRAESAPEVRADDEAETERGAEHAEVLGQAAT